MRKKICILGSIIAIALLTSCGNSISKLFGDKESQQVHVISTSSKGFGKSLMKGHFIQTKSGTPLKPMLEHLGFSKLDASESTSAITMLKNLFPLLEIYPSEVYDIEVGYYSGYIFYSSTKKDKGYLIYRRG